MSSHHSDHNLSIEDRSIAPDNRLRGSDCRDPAVISEDRVFIGQGDLGNGLFAASEIKAGERILVFVGPIIDFAMAASKGERECWPLQIGKNKYIDLQEPGCYANHSCDPNCGICEDRFLVALTDIPAGTELRYDYSTTVDEDYWSMTCRCGSSKCRGTINDFKYLGTPTRMYYLSIGIVQDFISRQYEGS